MFNRRLTVNLDSLAFFRTFRGGRDPEPVFVASLLDSIGIPGISATISSVGTTLKERDLLILREIIRADTILFVEDSIDSHSLALDLAPDIVCLVPQKFDPAAGQSAAFEITGNMEGLFNSVKKFGEKGIRTSILIPPEKLQIDAAKQLDVDGIYFEHFRHDRASMQKETIERLKNASLVADRLSLEVMTGGRLDMETLPQMTSMETVSRIHVGKMLFARSMAVGLEKALKEIQELF